MNEKTLRNLLYFDIETASSHPNFLSLRGENKRLCDLWLKRSLYYQSAYLELKDCSETNIYEQKSSLEAEFSKVICVSFGSFNEHGEKEYISFYGDNEIEILEKTSIVLSNAQKKGMLLCGHNIKGFDIPFLCKRFVYNKKTLPESIRVFGKKPWEISHLDTSEIFSFGSWTQQKYLSLDLLSSAMGIKSSKGNIDGSKVNKAYWSGSIEEIKKYCEEDVRVVMEVMEGLIETS